MFLLSISNPWAASASSMSFDPHRSEEFFLFPDAPGDRAGHPAEFRRSFFGLVLNLLRLLEDSLLLMLEGFEIPGVRLSGESFGYQKIPCVTVRDLDCVSRLAERLNILP